MRRVRQFFYERGVLEVDTPLLSRTASIDAHIDLIPATLNGATPCYLVSSPEYAMKKLLAQGVGDCYQLSHVFRDHESGPMHSNEFMMIEWYRCGFAFSEMIGETCEVIQLFLGEQSVETVSYREAFQEYAGVDPFEATDSELLDLIPAEERYEGLEREGRDGLLNILLANRVEPHLGRNGLTCLTQYPATQAALARTTRLDSHLVAERFEVYFGGVELANGYHELADGREQRRRLIEANALREMLRREPLPVDEEFLAALDALPECCGVAVGFDRLLQVTE